MVFAEPIPFMVLVAEAVMVARASLLAILDSGCVNRLVVSALRGSGAPAAPWAAFFEHFGERGGAAALYCLLARGIPGAVCTGARRCGPN